MDDIEIAPNAMAQPSIATSAENQINENDDYKARVKKLESSDKAKEQIENEVIAAKDKKNMIEKKAHESVTGLYKQEDGKLLFPDGKQVNGVNAGIFAQSEKKHKNKVEVEKLSIK